VEAIMKKILHIGFLLVLLATSLVAQNKPHIAARKDGIAENWISVWNSHDPDKLAAAFTADVVYEGRAIWGCQSRLRRAAQVCRL